MKFRQWDFPDNLLYDTHYQWIRPEGNKILFGLTPYGLDITGEILYLSLPAAGTTVTFDGNCGSLEAGKWVGRVYAPVSGKVVRVNEALLAAPRSVGARPYENWFAEIEASDPKELRRLMEAAGLAAWLAEDMKANA